MSRIPLLLFLATLVLGADDPWVKVRAIKSGTEIRVFKKGSKQPILGKIDQATEDAVIVVTKKEEIGIQREDVDRLDARPGPSISRVTKNSSTTTKYDPQSSDVATSSSSGLSIGSRPDYEIIYTRK